MTAVTRLLVLALAMACGGEPLPELAEVPPFELTAQDGRVFSSTELDGKVWVASFIFTTCPTVCPMISTQMGNLQRRITSDDFRLVSFTVDPANDTPEVLGRYAETHGADAARWSFLTGDVAAVQRVVTGGLKMPMGEHTATGDITHGTHFVLVGRNGRIRGFYRNDGDGLATLERDASRLLQEVQ